MLTTRFAACAVAFTTLALAPAAALAATRIEIDLADRLLVEARDAAARHPGTQAAQ